MSLLVLINADSTVNICDGALVEWNGYIVVFHFLAFCGSCCAALIALRMAGVARLMALTLMLIAPSLVYFCLPPIVASGQSNKHDLALFAFTGVLISSLPLVALSGVAALLPEWLRRFALDRNGRPQVDPYYLIALTAGGALLGIAFYTLLLQPCTSYDQMTHYCALVYAIAVTIASVLVAATLTKRLPVAWAVDAADVTTVTPLAQKYGRRRLIVFAALPSLLTIAAEPVLLAVLPGVAHAYVLPPAVCVLALALAFSRPPLVLEEFLIKSFPWVSAAAASLAVVANYINRYDLTVSLGVLSSLLLVSWASYTLAARQRLGCSTTSEFYLVGTGGALCGAVMAQLCTVAIGSITFPLALAAVCLGFVGVRLISAPRNR